MWRRLLTILKLLLLFALLIVLVAPEWPAFQDEPFLLKSQVGLREFDFILWAADALAAKGAAATTNGQAYTDAAARKETVLEYLRLVGEVQRLRGEILDIYSDPGVEDADAASALAQEQLDAVRAAMLEMQPLAEAVLQEQVAAVLAEEGFTLVDQVFPPVSMHMTPLPLVLIVSPREEIKQIYNVPLVPGLSIPEREVLETAVVETLDRSSLVVPIGGLGMYPAMVVETSNINYLANTIAHEWAHHWLTLRPLGIRYLASPEMRTINETVASILGDEIGARVIERYYPEFVPEEAPAVGEPAASAGSGEEVPETFDFQAEMAETRVHVDALLEQGKVDEAEAYMEERREMFVANGKPIRKLNQAYFAFYGAYAETPGATGEDPVGPAVVALREQSPSLGAFMQTVSRVTSFSDLERVVGAGGGNS